MLTGPLPAYVDRFACDWPRLATTDPYKSTKYYYTYSIAELQMFYASFASGKKYISVRAPPYRVCCTY